MTETVLTSYKTGKSKLAKWLRDEGADAEGFDTTFLEVDRILHTTEFFSVIHPHQATLIAGTWKEPLILILQKLMNFRKNEVCYAIPFLELEEPDEYPFYFANVRAPIDLASIMNKLYMGNYSGPDPFWRDVGMVFKNAQSFYTDARSDIRVCCDTLR
jgi:hypothetical protein